MWAVSKATVSVVAAAAEKLAASDFRFWKGSAASGCTGELAATGDLLAADDNDVADDKDNDNEDATAAVPAEEDCAANDADADDNAIDDNDDDDDEVAVVVVASVAPTTNADGGISSA